MASPIVPATYDDLAAIIPLAEAEKLSFLDRPDVEYWAVWEDGIVIACCAVWWKRDEAVLKSLWVHPAHRNRGLATTLVEFRLREAASRGYGKATMGCTRPGYGVYLASVPHSHVRDLKGIGGAVLEVDLRGWR